MLRYEHAEYLNLLFLLPIFIIGVIIYERWKKRSLAKFSETILLNRLMKVNYFGLIKREELFFFCNLLHIHITFNDFPES